MKDTVKFEKRTTLTVAHRGLSGIEPENTALAFTAAANRSYFGIETDIHRTADGRFLLTHDDNTRRVTGMEYVVEETPYDVLRALPLLDKGGATRENVRFASLAEYIGICKKYGKVAVLELKNVMRAEDIAAIVVSIEALDYLEGVIFISFYMENLLHLRAIRPTQAAQFLTDDALTDELLATLVEHRLDLDVYYKVLSEEWVQKLHAAGIRINVWTVDKPDVGETLAAWGVDFITTNILE